MNQEELKPIVEALLFISPEPLPVDKIASFLDEKDKKSIRRTLQDLSKDYEERCAGINIIEIAGGFQMCSSPSHAAFIKKFQEKRKKRVLSGASLEVLSIIAYKQPISRGEIEILRGINSEGVIHSLLERRLIQISGRKDVPGKPYLYKTTRYFLEHFALRSLSDLPKIEELHKPENSTESSNIEIEKEIIQEGEIKEEVPQISDFDNIETTSGSEEG